MNTVTVEAIENMFDGLKDKSVSKGEKYKMYEDIAKENADLGYVKIVPGNPDIEDKPKREVGTMTVDNIKPAEPEKILTSDKKEVKEDEEETKVTKVKEAKEPKKII